MSKHQERTEPPLTAEPIWQRARSDLKIPGPAHEADVFLWEHVERVAQTALRMLSLPEVRSHRPNERVVLTAALYHDAGWVTQARESEVTRLEVLVRGPGALHFEQSAMVLEKSLAKLMPRSELTQAVETVHAIPDRDTGLVEARIVADANNLDEFGLLSLWPTIRRGALEGKAVKAVLETWRRRQEYRFWEARLQDSFHFAAIRAVAERRLERFARFMSTLEMEAEGDDIDFPT